MADSAAEYFDASADVICDGSSEVSDESGLSDGSTTNSEPEEGHGEYMYTNDCLCNVHKIEGSRISVYCNQCNLF